MKILEIKNLKKTYNTSDHNIDVLKGINLTVNKGEFIAIIGRSGSGKSTLMHSIAGLESPTSGEIILNNKSISKMNEEEKSKIRNTEVGLIFQSYNLIPILTVIENIKLPLLSSDKSEIDDNYINSLIFDLGLKDKINFFPSQLSGGQQQRTAIARAMVNKPSIILADEPTGNLDSKTEKEVMQLLKKSQKKYNQTIIMITHNLELAEMADRIITIDDGFIKE
ncbi:ABC transporter ATP-binding protein [Peptacetobacter sp.]|uniref:ABC transporter ATP-binding protein n=1 Tax=Peptacetobacter sp. TaxID=2991975 RepID=UPI002605409E|nr:ABC transporter ATP-binding protein [Peptacetobacter sp.]